MIRPRCVLLDKECIGIGRDIEVSRTSFSTRCMSPECIPEYRKKHKISGQLPDPIYYHLFTVK